LRPCASAAAIQNSVLPLLQPGHVLVVVLTLEAEKAEQLVVEFLRAGEIADAQYEMIDADDARHGGSDPGIRLRSILNELRRGELRPGLSSAERPHRKGRFPDAAAWSAGICGAFPRAHGRSA
jgi:hypothetical protein